jgi:hypothetical protein
VCKINAVRVGRVRGSKKISEKRLYLSWRYTEFISRVYIYFYSDHSDHPDQQKKVAGFLWHLSVRVKGAMRWPEVVVG